MGLQPTGTGRLDGGAAGGASSHPGRRSGHAPDGSAAETVVEALLKVAQRLRGEMAAHFAEFGLSEVRYAVLEALLAAVPAGCSQNDLAARLGQSESSVSTLVERMRHSGLLYRLRAKADRRVRLLLPTEQGRELFGRASASHNDRIETLLRRLDAGQRTQLVQLLELLAGELSEATHSRAA